MWRILFHSRSTKLSSTGKLVEPQSLIVTTNLSVEKWTEAFVQQGETGQTVFDRHFGLGYLLCPWA